VQLTVNGRPADAEDGSTLTGVVATVTDRASGIAVAVNGEVVPRSGWDATRLQPGDRVDVVTAVQGG
jgi:sulfur carrier protein